jgi:hypothetical protein
VLELKIKKGEVKEKNSLNGKNKNKKLDLDLDLETSSHSPSLPPLSLPLFLLLWPLSLRIPGSLSICIFVWVFKKKNNNNKKKPLSVSTEESKKNKKKTNLSLSRRSLSQVSQVSLSLFLFHHHRLHRSNNLLHQVVVLVRQRGRGCLGQLRLVGRLLRQVDRDLGGSQSNLLHKVQLRVADKLPRQVQERLLVVVVGLGGDLVVLQVLLPVEGDLLGLHLPVFHVDLVSTKHDRDVLAHTAEVAVPGGHVLVGEARRDVKHDDGALTVDVVAVAEAAWGVVGVGKRRGRRRRRRRRRKKVNFFSVRNSKKKGKNISSYQTSPARPCPSSRSAACLGWS